MSKVIHAILLIGVILWLPINSATARDLCTVDTVNCSPKLLSWTAPVARTDGTVLMAGENAGYRLYYGVNPDNLVLDVDVACTTVDTTYCSGTETVTEYLYQVDMDIVNYFAVTAYDTDGLESAFSNVRNVGGVLPVNAPPTEPSSLIITDPVYLPPVTAIRINAGGLELTAADGSAWEADQYYTSGNVSSTTTITTGTPYPELFLTSRWKVGNLAYSIPVDNGNRTVTLLFAETFPFAQDTRIFSIEIEGVVVESSFNIATAAGGIGLAVEMPYSVDVTDGMLDITLLAESENPSINGINVE